VTGEHGGASHWAEDLGVCRQPAPKLGGDVRIQFFVALGFQMLADDTLTTAEWKKLRTCAKEKGDYLAKQTLADFRSRMESNE